MGGDGRRARRTRRARAARLLRHHQSCDSSNEDGTPAHIHRVGGLRCRRRREQGQRRQGKRVGRHRPVSSEHGAGVEGEREIFPALASATFLFTVAPAATLARRTTGPGLGPSGVTSRRRSSVVRFEGRTTSPSPTIPPPAPSTSSRPTPTHLSSTSNAPGPTATSSTAWRAPFLRRSQSPEGARHPKCGCTATSEVHDGDGSCWKQ